MTSIFGAILLERTSEQIDGALREVGFPPLFLLAARAISEHRSRRVGYLWLQLALGSAQIEIEVEQELLQHTATGIVPDARRVSFSQRALAHGITALAVSKAAQTLGATGRITSMSATPAHYQVALDRSEPLESEPLFLELCFACGDQPDALILRLPRTLLQEEPIAGELSKIANQLERIRCTADLFHLPGRRILLIPRKSFTNPVPEKLRMQPINETSVESLNEMALSASLNDESLANEVVVTVCSREQLRPSVRTELYLGSVELTLRQLLELRPGDQIVLEGLSLADVELRCGLTTVARGQIQSDGEQTSIRLHSLTSE